MTVPHALALAEEMIAVSRARTAYRPLQFGPGVVAEEM